MDCANRLGAEMLGLQAELDKSACSNEVSQTLRGGKEERNILV